MGGRNPRPRNDERVKEGGAAPSASQAASRPPRDLLEALGGNRAARAAFDAFSPSHRREYVEWINGAKTEPTRRRRIDAAIEKLAAGWRSR